jgi:LuxR family maltose regulon positive regulatory protein
MGELHFERNDLEAATRHLEEGIERALEWVGLGATTSRLLEDTGARDRLARLEDVDADTALSMVPGYITLARVRQAKGDADGALEALRKVERVAQNSRISPLWKGRTEKWGEAWRARLRMARGDVKSASRWARAAGLDATDELVYSHESELEYITLARLLLAQGMHEKAAVLLGRLLKAAQTGGRRHTEIELLVLRALVLRARNDEPGALATLRRALTLAEPEGYVRTFAEEGDPMVDLLQRQLKAWRGADDVPLEYVGKLLEALGEGITLPAGMDVRDTAGLTLDPITGRQLEVLKLLDSDLSNREIASRLFVSLDTVKSHTRHLYAKLGVHNRHQAIARARDLKLLD